MTFTEKVTGWHGFRLLLDCSHLKLTGAQHWIGQPAACEVCPDGRRIVAVDPVWAPKPPDTWGSEHGRGA